MNARPMRRFLFALAGHLGMTVADIEQRMDCREFAEWICYARYFRPLDDSWQQAGMIASATLAPYSKRGNAPKPEHFIPIERPPQHNTQIADALQMLQKDLDELRCQRPSG